MSEMLEPVALPLPPPVEVKTEPVENADQTLENAEEPVHTNGEMNGAEEALEIAVVKTEETIETVKTEHLETQSQGFQGRVVQVTNVSPGATLQQMATLFGFLGTVTDIRLYPSDESIVVNVKLCYVQYENTDQCGVAQHLTNTVFIDKALIVVPVNRVECPEEAECVSLLKSINAYSGLTTAAVLLQHITPSLNEIPALPPVPLITTSADPREIEEIRRTIFVDNVPDEINAGQLLAFFSGVGDVKYLRLCKDENKTENPKYSYVEFVAQESVSTAMQYNGVLFGGACLRVAYSKHAIYKPEGEKIEGNRPVRRVRESVLNGRRRTRSRSRRRSGSKKRSSSGKRSPRRKRSGSRSRSPRRRKRSSRSASIERRRRSRSRRRRSRRSRSPRRRSKSPKHSISPIRKKATPKLDTPKKSGSKSPDRKSKSKSPGRKSTSKSPAKSKSPDKKSKSPSPKRKSESPKRKSKSRSPKRKSKSRSPRRKSRSPRKKSRSPRRKSRSPRKKSRSPRKKSRSPRKKSKSPRRRSRSRSRRRSRSRSARRKSRITPSSKSRRSRSRSTTKKKSKKSSSRSPSRSKKKKMTKEKEKDEEKLQSLLTKIYTYEEEKEKGKKPVADEVVMPPAEVKQESED